MAFTQVAASPPTLTGTPNVFAAAEAAGTAVRPGTTLLVRNGAGSAITVTLTMGRTYNGYTITPPTVSVAAGATVAIGPLPADPFVQTTGIDTGWIEVTYSSVVTITRCVTT